MRVLVEHHIHCGQTLCQYSRPQIFGKNRLNFCWLSFLYVCVNFGFLTVKFWLRWFRCFDGGFFGGIYFLLFISFEIPILIIFFHFLVTFFISEYPFLILVLIDSFHLTLLLSFFYIFVFIVRISLTVRTFSWKCFHTVVIVFHTRKVIAVIFGSNFIWYFQRYNSSHLHLIFSEVQFLSSWCRTNVLCFQFSSLSNSARYVLGQQSSRWYRSLQRIYRWDLHHSATQYGYEVHQRWFFPVLQCHPPHSLHFRWLLPRRESYPSTSRPSPNCQHNQFCLLMTIFPLTISSFSIGPDLPWSYRSIRDAYFS